LKDFIDGTGITDLVVLKDELITQTPIEILEI
jgi:hypothetical protein